jgi:hypothetical protein
MKRISLITLILGTALVLVPVGSAVVYSDGGASSSKAVGASTQAVNQATQALLLRSEGLANYYGSGVSFRPDILGGDGGASTVSIPTATGDDSFAWRTVGIGAATLVGVMLLGLASLAATRRRQHPSF